MDTAPAAASGGHVAGVDPSADTPDSEPGTDGSVPVTGTPDAIWLNWKKAETLRHAIDAANARLSTTALAVASARTIADQAGVAVAVAVAEANRQRAILDDVARTIYMQGGNPTLLDVIFNANGDDLAAILNTSYYLQSISDDRVRRAIAALEAADAAKKAYADAATALDIAVTANTAAQHDRDALLTELEAVNAAYADAIATLSAPQVTVGADGCPTAVPDGTLRDGADIVGVHALCRFAVKHAATPQAALAIMWALQRLGAPYACGGVGRLLPYRMDCSSYVSRAYAEGAGMDTAGAGWAPSTRNMVPWDGVALDPHYVEVAPGAISPGDLVLYDTGGAAYRHVVMYLGEIDGVAYMAHTNSCGDVAHVSQFWGFDGGGHGTFLVARRVLNPH